MFYILGGCGGGVLILNVKEVCKVNGILSANGQDGHSYAGGGAGGSIDITTKEFDGTGDIAVNIILLTLNAPIAAKVVCFSRLLKCLRSLYGKQCGPRSDCSYRSSLFWVQTVCFYT